MTVCCAQIAQARKEGWRSPAATIQTDIAYGGNPLQKLDVYAPPVLKGQARPVHIFIHGGGWQNGDKKMAKDLGQFSVENGIVFVSINYRLSPKDMHPTHAQDCAAAVKWVYDNIGKFGGDKNNITLSGHSAGAHLAALIGTDPKYLNAHSLDPTLFHAVIPVDTGSFDFSVPLEKGGRRVNPMIDEAFGTDPAIRADASPITHARTNKNLPRFVMFVIANRPDAVQQTKNLDAALKTSGGSSEYHIMDGLTHRSVRLAMAEPESPVAQKILDVILR